MQMKQPDETSPAPVPVRRSLPQGAALPVSSSVTDRLVDLFILAAELRADLNEPDASHLAWMKREADSIITNTDATLKSLSS